MRNICREMSYSAYPVQDFAFQNTTMDTELRHAPKRKNIFRAQISFL